MQSSVVGLHFTFLVSYNLGQNLLGILYFLTHRTPIPRIWYRYGPLSSPHPDQGCSVGMRNDLVFLAAVFISSHNAPSPTKGCSYSNLVPLWRGAYVTRQKRLCGTLEVIQLDFNIIFMEGGAVVFVVIVFKNVFLIQDCNTGL